MHRIYRINSGIEFRLGVKTKILVIAAIASLVIVSLYLEDILAVLIAGF